MEEPPLFNRWVKASVALALLASGGGLVVMSVLDRDGRLTVENKPPPRSVFLIVVDTLRADRLSCYGYARHQTPNIDRLCERGVRFSEAHAVASWTLPSMGALHTSLYPRQLGLLEQAAHEGQRFGWATPRKQEQWGLFSPAPTLGEILQTAGFSTAAFVNQSALNHTATFARGFRDYFYVTTDGVERLAEGEEREIQEEYSTVEAYHCDSALVAKFEEWIARDRSSERVFAWLHLLTPHYPYLPIDPDAPRPRWSWRRFKEVEDPELSDLYDAEVRGIDGLVGRIVRSIEKHVGLDRSLIVLASDHGEEFRERGQVGHGHSVHREVTRVPLVFFAPRVVSPAVVEEHVRLIDVLPTVLDLLGLKSFTPGHIEGASLVPALSASLVSRPVYVEGVLYGGAKRSLTTDGHKLIFDIQENRYSLFDLKTDRLEEVDVAANQPERVAAMQREMKAWRVRLAAFDSSRIVPVGATDWIPPAPDDEQAMEALGYVGDDDG